MHNPRRNRQENLVKIEIRTLAQLQEKGPCKNYGIQKLSNLNLTSNDVKLNNNALHQQISTCFKVDNLEEMDIIQQYKDELKRKLMGPYQLFYPIKSFKLQRG